MKKRTAIPLSILASVFFALTNQTLPSGAVVASIPSFVRPTTKSSEVRTITTSKERRETQKNGSEKGKRKSIKRAASPGSSKADNDGIKYVSLTFDDGPSPIYTPKILAILKEEGICATFFVIGREAKKHPDILAQIVADGHKIADHSMNHDEHLNKRSDEKMAAEVLGTKTLIESIVPDASVEFYRAPAGRINRHQRKLVADWGMKAIDWSVDTKDWQKPGVNSILATVKRQVHNGGIILMHDSGGDRSETVAALKKMIPTLKDDGYQFVFPDTALAARKKPKQESSKIAKK